MPEDQDNNQNIKPEAPTLYGGKVRTPFWRVKDIGEGVTGKAEEVMYVHMESLNPVGLGLWVQQRRDLAQRFPPRPGQWVKAPQQVESVVLKLPSKPDSTIRGQFSMERAALLQLQSDFADEAVARPARLYGYGVRRRTAQPYLCLENMQLDHNMSQLDQYLGRQSMLPEKEALEIALRLAFVLNKAHKEGIVYNDISDQKLDNIFWNPTKKHVRLIDWANSDFFNGEFQSLLNPGYDRNGLARALFKLIIGRNCPSDLSRGITNDDWQKMSQPTRDVIGRGLYLSNDSYNGSNVEDTQKMYDDLKVALTTVAGRVT